MVFVVVLRRIRAYFQTELSQIPNSDNDRCLLVGFQSRSRIHTISVESIKYIDRHSLLAIITLTAWGERARRERPAIA